ncbi:GTP cyclohydrolase 1 [Fulvia fulva]|nr:GTP cyclohydrolase 1 [Fulvia fulva]KAK4614539.1 GTP cyclohydrolase 1 [Fulvia fulva]WPV20042.1 GTP cyclohydrolase 1 [Fulvia fulva]WPV35438.1 GTP cyclohydrolase 1 [Fulvia fulva]
MQQPVHDDTDQRRANIAAAAQTILANVGEDPDREGLLKTPERFAKALQFFTSGYGMNPEVVTNDAIFTVDCNDIVVVQGIDVSSLCEHHLVPFVLGLSKFVRIVEVYARRLQVQERLTKQVAEAIEQMLQPEGVVVMAECSHMCMSMRGVQQVGTVTTTLSRTGIFLRDAQVYEEFRSMLRR